MEKEFVPYELAVKLKELGFDEPCFGVYRYHRRSKTYTVAVTIYDSILNSGIKAPLWQQAFYFIKNNYKLHGQILHNGSDSYYWWINEVNNIFGIDINSIDDFDFSNYEEARQSCLEKLIEITQGG